jgi:hypothetical protein
MRLQRIKIHRKYWGTWFAYPTSTGDVMRLGSQTAKRLMNIPVLQRTKDLQTIIYYYLLFKDSVLCIQLISQWTKNPIALIICFSAKNGSFRATGTVSLCWWHLLSVRSMNSTTTQTPWQCCRIGAPHCIQCAVTEDARAVGCGALWSRSHAPVGNLPVEIG